MKAKRLILALLILCLPAISASKSEPRMGFSDVFCVVSCNGGDYQLTDTVFVKRTDRLTVQPVFEGNGKLYGAVGSFFKSGKRIEVLPLYSAKVSWYTAKPVFKKGGYDNFEDAPKDHFMSYVVPIEYRVSQLANSSPGIDLHDITGGKNGTFYLKAGQGLTENEFSYSGEINKKFRFLQVVVRPDDSYLGYAQELMNTPFIMYPKILPDGLHQTDERVGSDCAEMAIYARRRMGYNVPYCGPAKIYSYLNSVIPGKFCPRVVDGKLLLTDADGNTVKVGADGVEPGDILHYGSQVALFYKDAGIKGVLDGDDLVLQSYGEQPHIATLKQNFATFGGFAVYRWK